MAAALTAAAIATAAEYYAAPEGAGNGTLEQPWSLATVLAGEKVHPGDTVFLRGGTYRGTFVSNLKGAPGSPIVIRAAEGERAILDGSRSGQQFRNIPTLDIAGAYTHFIGLEIANSDPERKLAIAGSNPPERRGSGVNVRAPGIKLINSIIHDTGTALSAYKVALDFEAYGNLIYNNGWKAPDRGHGHGIYTQNETGTKVYADNIVLKQFGNTMNVYGSSAARLRNFRFTGNAFFAGRLLFGAHTGIENMVFEKNMSYGANMEIGYGTTTNESVVLRNNYIGTGIVFQSFREVAMADNTILNHQRNNGSRCVGITPPRDYDAARYRIDRNTYVQCTPGGMDFRFPGKLFTFAQWQEMGFDRASRYTSVPGPDAKLPGVKVFLRKNEYDPGRAMLVIFNWERSDELTIDLSSFLSPGEAYEIRNAQDYFGDVVRAIHEGKPVTIRMTGHTVALPAGWEAPLQPSTFPQAGVFVLVKGHAAKGPIPR